MRLTEIQDPFWECLRFERDFTIFSAKEDNSDGGIPASVVCQGKRSIWGQGFPSKAIQLMNLGQRFLWGDKCLSSWWASVPKYI